MAPKHTCLILLLLLTVCTSHAQTSKTDTSANLSITDKVYSDTTDEYKLPDPDDIPAVDEDHADAAPAAEYLAPTAPKATGTPEPARPAVPVARKIAIPALPDVPAGEKIYHYPEYMPRPTVDIKKYMHDNAHAIADDKGKSIHGTVIVNFIINEDGSLSDFKIRKSLGAACDAEALRLAKAMPRWQAGMMPGRKSVKTYYDLPVVFE